MYCKEKKGENKDYKIVDLKVGIGKIPSFRVLSRVRTYRVVLIPQLTLVVAPSSTTSGPTGAARDNISQNSSHQTRRLLQQSITSLVKGVNNKVFDVGMGFETYQKKDILGPETRTVLYNHFDGHVINCSNTRPRNLMKD